MPCDVFSDGAERCSTARGETHSDEPRTQILNTLCVGGLNINALLRSVHVSVRQSVCVFDGEKGG